MPTRRETISRLASLPALASVECDIRVESEIEASDLVIIQTSRRLEYEEAKRIQQDIEKVFSEYPQMPKCVVLDPTATLRVERGIAKIERT
jgi:uncharacterized protein YijF (DUF1287 family)